MDKTIKNKLFQLSTTHFCDASKNIRLLDSNIKPLVKNKKMAGIALTVRSEGDVLPIIKSFEFVDHNSVLIIDSSGSPYALAGEIFSTAAFNIGMQGIVIDGFCRDISEIKRIELPFYSRGVCSRAGTKNKSGSIQTDVICGGVRISPGDIVFGDSNGVIIMSSNELIETMPIAEEIKFKEETAIKKIKNGQKLADMFNFREHYKKVSTGEDSEFCWS